MNATKAMTVAELSAALATMRQDALVMLVVRPDAAGWLRRVGEDTGAVTVDLHVDDPDDEQSERSPSAEQERDWSEQYDGTSFGA